MRRWIDLFETELDDVGVSDLVRTTKSNHDLMLHSWMGRAYHDMSSVSFRKALADEIDAIRTKLIPLAKGPFEVMRGLYRPYNPERGIGIHWTISRFVAADHGPYIMHALVRPTDVDWPATVARRIGWPKEDEISLKIGTEIAINEITKGAEVIARDLKGTVLSKLP